MFFREHELLDGPAFDEVFLNDALEHCGSHRVIPRALWINHRNRPLVSDAKTIRLRTINGVFRSRESQFFQSLFLGNSTKRGLLLSGRIPAWSDPRTGRCDGGSF